jgi:FtsP/CotA-like multicopper oxidase with cupredoxin domain
MSSTKAQRVIGLVLRTAAVLALPFAITEQAAEPGIGGPAFSLQAAEGYTTQPAGTSIYTWGYGCAGAAPAFLPAGVGNAKCPAMQLPGPTMIVTAGDTVKVTLRNNLPKAAGNTSLLFPGFDVSAAAATGESGACATAATGVLTMEAANGCAVTYTFTVAATQAGTYAYYSGTQGDLQVEMGLHGALIVLPKLAAALPAGYVTPAGPLDRGRLPPAPKRNTGSPSPPTTIRPPATTANTCSSFRRSIRRFTSRPSSRSGPIRREPLRATSRRVAWW